MYIVDKVYRDGYRRYYTRAEVEEAHATGLRVPSEFPMVVLFGWGVIRVGPGCGSYGKIKEIYNQKDTANLAAKWYNEKSEENHEHQN